MSSNWRRFEVLLPLQFNDGRDVPTEWLAEAVLEIVAYFCGRARNQAGSIRAAMVTHTLVVTTWRAFFVA